MKKYEKKKLFMMKFGRREIQVVTNSVLIVQV